MMSQQKPSKPTPQQQSDQWLIKLESEQVKGPYSTDVICKMILEGIFSGQEYVARYPQGDWRPLSKQMEFYETLLESLENPVERDEKKAVKMDAETVIRVSPVAPKAIEEVESDKPEDINAKFAADLQKLLNPEEGDEVLLNQKGDKDDKPAKPNVVRTQTLEEKQKIQFQFEQGQMRQKRQEILRKLFPIFIVVVVGLIGWLAIEFSSEPSVNKSWVLITPDFKKPDIPAEEARQLKVKAVSMIRGGVVDDLLKAQNYLVQSIEGQKNDMESLGLLCTVYNSLWPYTKQLANDLKAVSAVVKHARLTNPLSSYSDTCQTVYLLVKGQTNDARAVLEKLLDQNSEKSFILFPFLYVIKGELLEETGSLVNAEAYYTEAVKQFSGWMKAKYNVGRVEYKQSKYSEAISTFDEILAKNPKYKAAMYGLALSLQKLKTDRDAFDIFSKAYDIRQTIPKDLHLEALQEYAALLMDRKENKKALEVVQTALRISPTHRAMKDLFISLGGESLAIESAQVTELIIEGDQFFRLGDYLAAQGRYRAAFDNDQKNTLLALKIAKSMRALTQIRDSLSWIDRAIAIDPKLFAAYSLKADYLIQRYNFVDAETTLSAAQKIDPNNYEILKSRARLEWKKNNLTQALIIGTKAFKQYDVDVELLTLLAHINIEIYFRPDKPGLEGTDPEKANALESAQRYSARAIDLEPAWPESQITYAKYLFAKEGSQRSEKYYLELIKSFPYTVDYRLALAEFYEHQEKTNTAQEIYQRVVDADPKSTKANLGLARCYKSKNDYTNAIRYYMVAAALDPSDVEPMFSVAQLQLEMGENDSNATAANKLLSEALTRFELVKKNNSNFPKVYYFTAKAKIAMGLYKEAMQDITTEKSKNPNLADPYILSAEIFKKQGQYTQCAQDYTIVLKLRPVSEFYFKTAACHRLAGTIDLAEDLVKEGHEKESANYAYFREMGYIMEARGENARAYKYFQDYLDLTAHNSFDAKEIESKLSSLGN
jgi:tetratricopeptide (TPR) repeat protein